MNEFILLAYEFLASFVPFLAMFFPLRHLHKRRGCPATAKDNCLAFLLALYVIGVFHVTGAGTLYDGLSRHFQIRPDQVNFIPFHNDIDVVGYLLNILLFLPFGVLVPLIWRKKAHILPILLSGFGFSLLIELSQLLNNRSTDIDDLILNTLGAAIGFALYSAFSKLRKPPATSQGAPAVDLGLYLAALFLGRFLLFYEMGLAKVLYGF